MCFGLCFFVDIDGLEGCIYVMYSYSYLTLESKGKVVRLAIYRFLFFGKRHIPSAFLIGQRIEKEKINNDDQLDDDKKTPHGVRA